MMRKRVQSLVTNNSVLADRDWLDVEGLAQVEVTSEDPTHPIESAVLPGTESGWRASQPGTQTIRRIFDRPQALHRISSLFIESDLSNYVSQYLPSEVEEVKPDTPLFWSTYGRRHQGVVRQPMEGKNVWRLCKTYGRPIGYPMLKPHDLRHGVAMEVYEEHHDLEQVRGLLGHKSI
jgi:integrase